MTEDKIILQQKNDNGQSMHSFKLGSMKISKLLLIMSLPAIFSMFVQSLYNIVDSIFVSKISSLALEALSIAFPLQMLILAVALGVGVGTKTQISRVLGEQKVEKASELAKSALTLCIVSGIATIIVINLIVEPFFKFFTTDAEVIAYGVKYMRIVGSCSIFIFVELCCSKILQATGNMRAPMISQLIGALTNIILDPILIFGFLGLPAMGIAGAALATVIGQFFSMCFIVTQVAFKKQDVNLSFKGFKFRWNNYAAIIKVGIPVAVLNTLSSVTIILLNLALKKYQDGVTILGIYFKLQSFVFMPLMGLVQGAMPILSYNYGSHNRERFFSCFKLTNIVGLIFMGIGTILFMVMPKILLLLFNATPNMMVEGSIALRILSVAFLFTAVNNVLSSTFQCISMGGFSMTINVTRQIILNVSLSFILSAMFGLRALWWGYPISEIIGLLVFLPIGMRIFNKKV